MAHKPSQKQARIIEFIKRNLGIEFDVNGAQTPYGFIGEHKVKAERAYRLNHRVPEVEHERDYTSNLRADEWGGIPNH